MVSGSQERNGALYRIEGRITGEGMNELATALGERGCPPPSVVVDLSGVQFADPSGLAALRALLGRGAVAVGCSGFLEELLRTTASAETAHAERDPIAADRALVDRLREGDEDAFEQLVRAHTGRLLATARRLLRNEEEAEEAVQDAFLSAFRGIRSFADNAKLSPWLHRIAVNCALMKLRSRRRRREDLLLDGPPRRDDASGWIEPDRSPLLAILDDDSVEREEMQTIVRRCIDRLSDTYRTILLLRDIEELDTQEVAEQLDITPNAVKVRLHRAHQALRALLAAELKDPEDRAVHQRAPVGLASN